MIILDGLFNYSLIDNDKIIFQPQSHLILLNSAKNFFTHIQILQMKFS